VEKCGLGGRSFTVAALITSEECARKLAAYEAAGLQMAFVWPVAEELEQLEIFFAKVVPLVEKAR